MIVLASRSKSRYIIPRESHVYVYAVWGAVCSVINACGTRGQVFSSIFANRRLFWDIMCPSHITSWRYNSALSPRPEKTFFDCFSRYLIEPWYDRTNDNKSKNNLSRSFYEFLVLGEALDLFICEGQVLIICSVVIVASRLAKVQILDWAFTKPT